MEDYFFKASFPTEARAC